MFQPLPQSTPLQGIRVLDLGRYQAAPRCALLLARLGADVIKVEPPAGEEGRQIGPFVRGQSAYWAQHNSGKRSIALDLRRQAGRRVLERLVAVSDVLIQNFRPGVIEDMGFGYDRLKGLNPRIIMVNVSGFGRSGPMRARLAFDQVGQAISGYMSLNGDPAGLPMISPFPLVDRITALHAAVATLAALYERQTSGLGQEIDVCLADAAYSTVELPIAAYLGTGEAPDRTGNAISLGNMFGCKDGYVYIADFGGDRIFPRLARAIRKGEWLEDARFADRRGRETHSGIVEAALVEWCGTRNAAEAEGALTAAGVVCARVNDIPAATRDPYFTYARPMAEVADSVAGSLHVPGRFFRFSRNDLPIGPAPSPGEHTDEILRGLLRMSGPEIAALRSEGVV